MALLKGGKGKGGKGAGPVIGQIPTHKIYNTPMAPGKSTARKEVKK